MIQTFNGAQQQVWFDDALLHEDQVNAATRVLTAKRQSARKRDGAGHHVVCTVAADTRCVASLPPRWFVWQTGGRFLRFHRLGKTRSYQEFMLLNHLCDAGVNVPGPIAARVQKNGLLYKADLLSEKCRMPAIW